MRCRRIRLQAASHWIPGLAFWIAAGVWTGCAAPAGRPLTFEAIYGPGRVELTGPVARGMRWLPDGRHYVERRDGVLHRVDPLTGESLPAYDHEALRAAVAGHPEIGDAAAGRLARQPTLLSDDFAIAVIEHGDGLFVYRFADGMLQRVVDAEADRELMTLGPDGSHVAFHARGNLYTIDLSTGQQTVLTTDGSETLLNGKLDWVYQEEVYGRGQWQAYWWSDDGRYLAYLQLDVSHVPVYTILNDLPTHPEVETMRYPKAGDPNPVARLGVVPASGGPTTWVDLSACGDTELLIVRVGWSPDGRVIYEVQDREQRWLELNDADPDTGAARRLLREESPAWVDVYGLPRWLADGSFLWISAADGWPHLYHHERDGALRARLTAGSWEVREIEALNQAGGWVYVSGTRDGPVEQHLYRVPLTGGDVERLTDLGFTHRVTVAPTGRFYFDTFSNLHTPPKVHLRQTDGALRRELSDADRPVRAEYAFSQPALLRIPTPQGHFLNASLVRPPQRRPGQRLPVVMFVYGGPHAPIVHNRWEGEHGFLKQWLAQQGYLVWTCDPYSASGEGAVSAWHAYGRLGVTEVQDLEASLHWLAEHEHADLTRVAIEGYSYGGFLIAYALTHSTLFKVGIAGAPVSDWRNYDSIYTERFMQTPANNARGYAVSSVRAAAGKLHGHLLLVHGTLDDNVHLQNTLQLAHDLQAAGKTFEMMLYPANGHGIGHNRHHWLKLWLGFIQRNL